jgi:putative oxidoreductase
MITELPQTVIDIALLLLRLIVAIIFFTSGRKHFMQPREEGISLGLPSRATFTLGIAEIIGAISVGLGVFTGHGALILMVTMLGAIYMKVIRWNTGFYSDKGFGWHYDLLLFAASAVIFASGGGTYILVEA